MSKKKEKNVTTELAIKDMSDTTLLLEKLDSELAKVRTIEETPYKTGGTIDGFGDIKTETKIENLIRAYSSYKGRFNAYVDSATDLGINTYPAFGPSLEDVSHDIKLRIAIIRQDVKTKALKEAKTQISKFMSEEEQKLMIFKDLAKLLAE